jgi:hypothetical protein
MTAPGWEGILDEDEEILWQGRPVAGFDWSEIISGNAIGGLLATGFGVFWTIMAITMMAEARSGPPLIFRIFFPLFGVFFVLAALRGVIKEPLNSYRRQRGTFYTLSNRAAYIATDVGGTRSLDRFLLSDMARLRLVDGNPGAVMFGTSTGRKGRSRLAEAGFLRLEDAREVFAILRDARDAVRRNT